MSCAAGRYSPFMGLAGMIFAAIQVFNFKLMTCQVGNIGAVGSRIDIGVQAGQRVPGASQVQMAGNLLENKGVVEALQRRELQEEQAERELLQTMSGSDSDLEELSKGSFAGCLMIMDDNHFLVEWLAYHWFTLPMRHLTVMIDEKSMTSPLGIFDRWKGKMTIEVVNWTYPGVLAPVPGYLKNEKEIQNYLGRQNSFYGDCMKQYSRRNWKSWVLLHDTDEFIGVNRWVDNKSHPLYDGIIPSANESGSVFKRLEQMAHLGDTCVSTNRTQTCTETDNVKSTETAKLGMDDNDFLTFRWNMGHTLKNPKQMIHTGKVEKEYFEQLDFLNEGTAHAISPGRECPDRPFFRMYHYPGNEAQRTFRDSVDPRGGFNNRVGGSRVLIPRACIPQPVYHIQPWVQGLIDMVGLEEARRLLDGTGQTRPNGQMWPMYRHGAMFD